MVVWLLLVVECMVEVVDGMCGYMGGVFDKMCEVIVVFEYVVEGVQGKLVLVFVKCLFVVVVFVDQVVVQFVLLLCEFLWMGLVNFFVLVG